MDAFKVILEKLNTIESRLGKLEVGNGKESIVSETTPQKTSRDELFGKALALVDKYEEIPSELLQRELSVEEGRANAILDQLEAAGYGSCYFGEVKK